MSEKNKNNNTKNIHQTLDELDRNISNIDPVLDKLAERIRKPKGDLENIIVDLTQISKKSPNSERLDNDEHKISFIFDLITKLLPIITICSILFGFAVTYKYLNIIDKTALFPEITSQHQSIFAILIFYLLNIFLLISCFFIINIKAVFSSKLKKMIDEDPCYYFILIILILIFIFLIILNKDIYFCIIFLCSLILYMLILFGIDLKKHKQFTMLEVFADCFFIFIFLFALSLILSLFFYINIDIASIPSWKNDNLFSLIYISGIILLLCGDLYYNLENTKVEWKTKYMLSIPLAIFLFICSSLFSTKQIEQSLHSPRFIEKPQNSSWYLIHNGNTTSENINGLSKRDILAQKDIFNAKDCTTLKNKDGKKKCQDDNKDILNNRDNALYGYMAWNLGNTKVFCPVSVDFFDDKDNTEKSAKCLVIDGKYLQLISHHYLSQK